MSADSRIDRRSFLGAGAATSLLGAGNAGAMIAQEALGRATVVLHDPRLRLDESVAKRLAEQGARVIALAEDPVRQWRGEVGALLADPATKLFGVTRWADLLIVRGLAAESRRHLRHEQLHPESGAFTWLIE